MEIEILKSEETIIAELISDEIIIRDVHDALDLMANVYEHGARKIIVKEKNITPDFFDLKTGLAGEILQKFINYSVQLAIIGDFSKFKSKNFQDLIYESNKAGRIMFLQKREMAIESFSLGQNAI